MIDVITMCALGGIAVFFGILATVYFWLEHNAKNNETFATNPLKLKWVIGGILGGATAAGIMIGILWYMPDLEVTEVLAKFAAITAALGIVIAKVYNEGISAVTKWMLQHTKKVAEVVKDPEIQELKEQLDIILKSLKGNP